MNTVQSTQPLTNIAAPTYPQAEIDDALRTIENARNLPEGERIVLEGTPEWDVLKRFYFHGEPWAGTTPELAWVLLTESTHPRNPFQTECPSWCNLTVRGFKHDDSIWNETGEQFTAHEAPVVLTPLVSIIRLREDLLHADGTVGARERLQILEGGDGELDIIAAPDLLRECAATLVKAADALDEVTA